MKTLKFHKIIMETKKIIEFHARITKTIKILEFHMRIMKIIKNIINQLENNENHLNFRIPLKNQ